MALRSSRVAGLPPANRSESLSGIEIVEVATEAGMSAGFSSSATTGKRPIPSSAQMAPEPRTWRSKRHGKAFFIRLSVRGKEGRAVTPGKLEKDVPRRNLGPDKIIPQFNRRRYVLSRHILGIAGRPGYETVKKL